MNKALFTATTIFLLFSCNTNKLTPVCDGSTPTYEGEVEAIMMQSCSSTTSCHGTGCNKHRGELTTYAQVKASVDEGDFQKHVLVKQNMPKGSTLTQDEINIIQCWINSGATEK